MYIHSSFVNASGTVTEDGPSKWYLKSNLIMKVIHKDK